MAIPIRLQWLSLGFVISAQGDDLPFGFLNSVPPTAFTLRGSRVLQISLHFIRLLWNYARDLLRNRRFRRGLRRYNELPNYSHPERGIYSESNGYNLRGPSLGKWVHPNITPPYSRSFDCDGSALLHRLRSGWLGGRFILKLLAI